MKLLALDTSTDACSAAVYANDAVHESYELAPRRHAQLLLGMVEAVMAEAKCDLSALDAIAFGRGPGSFTGVRIATSTAQALAFGAGLPLVPVSSLAAVAQAAFGEHGVRRCAAAFDARMDEVYYGTFEIDAKGIARPAQIERVCLPGEVPLLSGNSWAGVGPGWKVYAAQLRKRLGDRIGPIYAELFPRARAVAVLGAADFNGGHAVTADAALPVYLRDQVTRS